MQTCLQVGEKKLTLIFAPADINKRDLGVYFNMVPGGFCCRAKPNYERSKKKFWTTLYTQTVMPSLLSTIDQFDLDNYTQDGVFSDTKVIAILRTNLKGNCERKDQACTGAMVIGRYFRVKAFCCLHR